MAWKPESLTGRERAKFSPVLTETWFISERLECFTEYWSVVYFKPKTEVEKKVCSYSANFKTV